MEAMNILVVDDNENNRNELIDGLIEYGFKRENVIGVGTGMEAVEMVKMNPEFFDVAVIDHILKNQEMDGIETTGKINDHSSKIFPIIFTNIPSDEPKTVAFHRAKAYEAGAYRYMYRAGSAYAASQVKDFIAQIRQLSQLRDKVSKYYEAQQNVPSLLKQLDIMIALIDRDFIVWYMNEANKRFQKMYDLPRTPCYMAFFGYKTTSPCRGCIVKKTLNDGKSRERIYLHPFKGLDGKLRWIHSWTQPISDEKGNAILADDGKPIAVLESTQDLTDSVFLRTMPVEERVSYIALALYEREDGFDRVRIYEADAKGENLTLVAHAGYPGVIHPAVKLLISAFPNVGRSIRHLKKNDEGFFFEKPENPDPLDPKEYMEKFIHWPLMKGEHLIGLISVSEAGSGRTCTEDKIDFLRDYAEEALKAFAAQLGEPEDREVEKKISELDKLLIQKRTTEETMQTLIDGVYRLTASDNVYVRYKAENKARLFPIAKGPYFKHAPFEIPFSNRIVPSVRSIITGQEEINNITKTDPDVGKFMETLSDDVREVLKDMCAYCIEPLLFLNSCIGSLVLFKNGENHYSEQEIKIARAIADRMALTLHDYLVNIDRMQKDYAMDSSINAIAFTDLDNDLNYINESFRVMWGYDEEDEFLGKPFLKLWENERKVAKVLETLHKDEGWIGELVALRKDGSTFDAQLSASPVKDKAGKIIGTMAAIIDITRQKRLQKVQNAIYSISEKASSAQNLDELYKDIHKIVNRLMPAENFYIALYDEKDDSISFPFFVDEYDDLPPPMKLGKTMTAYVLRTGKPKLASAKDCEELEKRGEAERFGTLPLYWLGVPLKTTGNKTIGVLVVQIYEQGRKYTEEDKGMLGFVSTQIARAIERKREEQRKEVLQREIHHRVKNNFNFIYSLLDMQSRQIEDQRVKEIFEFTQDRIMLMAMVHEKLYQSENLSEIDFARFVKDLSDSLIRSYSIEENRVSLILNVKNVSLGIDKAIPCGLIINELVTNSLKYAFPLYHENEDHSENKIVIGLHPEGENTMVLRVMDNGVGLPENIDFFDTSTLGLRLVRLLSKQIHGEIDLNREVGTDVSVTFEV